MRAGVAAVLALVLAAGCAPGEPVEVEPPVIFPNAPRIVHIRSYGSQHDIAPPSAFRKWLLGDDIYDENQGWIKPWGVAVAKGKVYVNDGRRTAGYWVFDLEQNQLELIQDPLVAGSLGMDTDDRDFKYLAVPRLAEAKSRQTINTEEEEGAVVVFDDNDKLYAQARILGRPLDVTVSGDELFVTDGINQRVLVFNKYDLTPLREFGKQGMERGEFTFPRAITSGQDGLIFVSDVFGGHIQVYDRSGVFVAHYGQKGRILGTFINLSGIDVDRNGRVYAIDSGYYQKFALDEIQVFDSNKFYTRDEALPSMETKLEDRKNALYGYFQKPNAISSTGTSLYTPIDLVIDYQNVEYFNQYAPPGETFEYLIWLTSAFAANGRDLSVFGFLGDE